MVVLQFVLLIKTEVIICHKQSQELKESAAAPIGLMLVLVVLVLSFSFYLVPESMI